MDCREITQAPVAIQIMQTPGDKRLQQLFHCIYFLFHGSFLNWILRKYSNGNAGHKDKLWEDAKDAFQNGLIALYHKAQKKEITIRSLKTTIYSFGLIQLLAFFKKEKYVNRPDDYTGYYDLLFEDASLEKERKELLDEREQVLMEALSALSKKQRNILLMKFFDNLKSKQIAEKLNVTPGSIDNETTRAYKELRSILKSKFIPPLAEQKQKQWS